MRSISKNSVLSLTASISLVLSGSLQAAPASMQEMWKIIQQQQKEIENLKAKSAQNEALQQEITTLKQTQKEQGQAIQTTTAQAQPVNSAPKASNKADLERKTDVLASEVEKIKTQMFIPETREYKSEYGLGPAASNVYHVSKGLSMGGYGEAMYTNYMNPQNQDSIDLKRAVVYLGYKFNDWVILNNEIEFEHASTGEGPETKGEVSVEFSQLDFLLNPKYNIRTGLMLVPMGFINEMHEPTTYHGNHRPDVEQYIIPSTWREMGAGVFGEILPGLQYRVYAMNGLNASNFSSKGIKEGRGGGSNSKAEDFAISGRVDYTPDKIPGLLVGAATFLGNSGQAQTYGSAKVDVFTQLYEGHVQYKYRGWELRALGAFGKINNSQYLNLESLSNLNPDDRTVVGKENFGWYVEAAHDIMPMLWKESSQYLAPFFRVERYNTLASVALNPNTGYAFDSSTGLDRWIYQAGLSYKPIENIVIKADYRNIHDRKLVTGMPYGDEFNLGVGFIY